MAYKLYKETDKNIVIYVSSLYVGNQMYDYFHELFGGREIDNVILVPSEELIRVEYISASKEILAEQIHALYSLIDCNHKIIIVTPGMAYRFLPSKELLLESKISLKINKELSFAGFKKKLSEIGYLRVNKVDSSLQFAARGDIVDVYTLNYPNPIRIEFFGDEIDSIRFFDVSTQSSINEVDEVEILPATINLLSKKESEDAITKIYNQLNQDKLSLKDPARGLIEDNVKEDLEEIKRGVLSQKNYKYMGFLQAFHTKITDLFNNFVSIIDSKTDFEKDKELMFNEGQNFLYDLSQNGKTISHLAYYDERRKLLEGSSFNYVIDKYHFEEKAIRLDFKKPIIGSMKDRNLANTIKGYLDLHYHILVLVNSTIQEESIRLALAQLNISYTKTEDFNIDTNYEVSIAHNNLPLGIELPLDEVVCLTSNELFGYKRSKTTYSAKFKEGVVLGSYQDLEPGDYVVHETKGIGQFLGIQTLVINGNHEDFLQILYANNDKIYVPLYQFNLIRKYVGKEGKVPQLSSLNNDKWNKTKKRIKDKINDLALRLLDLYQTRKTEQGFAFEKDDEIQKEFEDSFQFELTPDQEKSLEEIKQDMESPYPMDRLLCGDVGYGKTELAFRAAMKATLSGKQTIFLCPTTLLARQHYAVATERFKNFGVRVALLTRLQSDAQNNRTIKDINEGKYDLIIGTHKVLSKKLNCPNLGLLIIDEEQRFGVEQKERIKEKFPNIDCLTLSATPIPRTLQSTLIGLKSISTINTPPKERNAVQTYVMNYDKDVVKELIQRELNRGGQIFYVYNSVERIYEKYRILENLVPECRIGIVHGQMNKEEIEDVMNDFYSGKIDLLLATSIIENGIDVRNANLMIIDGADHFGLAQLYQIRGRVGRGDKIAFCYLMISSYKNITPEAKKRLKAIQDFSELGSGYKIAQRDLMIRGAGDILGSQQAGFIDEVGVDLYIKILNETIEEHTKGTKEQKEEKYASISLDAYIPSEFASDQDKVELYQKIIDCKTLSDLEKFRAKTRDMYGKTPLNFELLLKKKKIDIYLNSEECFDSIKEVLDTVYLNLSSKFSQIDGIGNKLFKALILSINRLKVNYKNKMLSILIKKEEDDWLDLLVTTMEAIIKLYHRYLNEQKEEEEIEENEAR